MQHRRCLQFVALLERICHCGHMRYLGKESPRLQHLDPRFGKKMPLYHKILEWKTVGDPREFVRSHVRPTEPNLSMQFCDYR